MLPLGTAAVHTCSWHTLQCARPPSPPRPPLRPPGPALQAKLPSAQGFILFPLVVHTLDLVVSAIGILSISSKPPAAGAAAEDPYSGVGRRGNVWGAWG